METAMQGLREALQRMDELAVAYFEAKGISVPTVAEGRWATLLARQAVTPAQQGAEAKVHGEGKPEEAEHGQTYICHGGSYGDHGCCEGQGCRQDVDAGGSEDIADKGAMAGEADVSSKVRIDVGRSEE
ncbi:hypothetical protein MTO96_006981 [Rhipicephalus appendiculatus]